ncbi:MAG: ABC transporter permease subunit [Candidatus Omnitrophica bacterium]|nr:ABC transporter permease subunit [Candidatus Omnitrophota bacterium]
MRTIILIAQHSFKELIRKKDLYVFFLLLVGIMLFFSLNSSFGVSDTSRYLKDIGYTLILLFSVIITISFSAKQIPVELSSKTIYPLLAKPVSRTDVVLGKFLSGSLISFCSFTIFFLCYIIMVLLKGSSTSIILITQSYVLTLLLLSLLSSISIFFSLFLSTGANVTITLLLYFFISYYNSMLRDMLITAKGAVYYIYSTLFYLLPHFDFYDIKIRLVHDWDPVALWAFGSIILYSFFYITIILILSSAVFKKRSL